jgi:hypothetical protein
MLGRVADVSCKTQGLPDSKRPVLCESTKSPARKPEPARWPKMARPRPDFSMHWPEPGPKPETNFKTRAGPGFRAGSAKIPIPRPT